MKRPSKKLLSVAAALVLALGLAVPAMAAEAPGLKVQLNGEDMAFTDAIPTMKDNRNYLPFRAVFEALGAEVSFDAATGTVTAVRDGRTLTMAIGSTAATVAENGVTTPINMDAAPYIEGGRTYVPVRFAAQAFGCAVGWDQKAQTVVVVDTVKLLDDAVEGRHYTLIEKLAAYGEKYSSGAWAMDGAVNMKTSVLGTQIMTGDCAVNGVIADTTRLQMGTDMNMDMTGLATLMAAMGEDVSALDSADLKMDVKVDVRGDLTEGKIYMRLGGLSADELGLPKDAWILMDVSEELRKGGLDLNSLLEASKQDWRTALSASLAASLVAVPINDSAAAYTALAAAADSLAGKFSDEGFTKTATGYTNQFKTDSQGVKVTLDMAVTTNAAGDITGYDQTMGVTVDVKSILDKLEDKQVQTAVEQLTAIGFKLDTLDMNMKATMNDAGSNTVTMSMALGNIFSMDMDGSIKLSATSNAPETAPPAGATVIDINDLAAIPAA